MPLEKLVFWGLGILASLFSGSVFIWLRMIGSGISDLRDQQAEMNAQVSEFRGRVDAVLEVQKDRIEHIERMLEREAS